LIWTLAVRYYNSRGQALPSEGGFLDQDEDLMDAVLDAVARINWHDKRLKGRSSGDRPTPSATRQARLEDL
jgi:hypothetical protein